jgi:extradiol dioxygenase family protein
MAGVKFLVEPVVLDKGPGGAQATVFFADPSGNVLEFKSFKDRERMFAR